MEHRNDVLIVAGDIGDNEAVLRDTLAWLAGRFREVFFLVPRPSGGRYRGESLGWAVGSGPYVPTVRLLRELQLPTSRAAQLLQLAAETGIQGAAIHHDATLTADQKRGELAALQGAVRPQLDALVPPAAQSKLPPEGIAWFTALGEGRYAPHRTTANSSGWFTATPISVTTPPRTSLQEVPLPRR